MKRHSPTNVARHCGIKSNIEHIPLANLAQINSHLSKLIFTVRRHVLHSTLDRIVRSNKPAITEIGSVLLSPMLQNSNQFLVIALYRTAELLLAIFKRLCTKTEADIITVDETQTLRSAVRRDLHKTFDYQILIVALKWKLWNLRLVRSCLIVQSLCSFEFTFQLLDRSRIFLFSQPACYLFSPSTHLFRT